MLRVRLILGFILMILVFAAALFAGTPLLWWPDQLLAGLVWGAVWAVALLVTSVGFVFFVRNILAERQALVAPVLRASDAGIPAPAQESPWGYEVLVQALVDTFAGAPYSVRQHEGTVIVQADLEDVRWTSMATATSLKETFIVQLRQVRPGVFERSEQRRRVRWERGVAQLGGVVTETAGRVWSTRIQRTYRFTPEGLSKTADFAFSTAEISEPVAALLKRAGWRQVMDGSTKGALVMGALGASAIVIVPLVFLVRHLL